MSIATRLTSSTARPRLDLSGCVFYAPLWRPNLAVSPFRTLDSFNHSCTVTEATYGRQGRTFDGSNDQITSAASTAFEVTDSTGFTLGGWFNKTAADLNMLGIGFSNEPTQSQRLELWVQRNNASSNTVRLFSSDGGGGQATAVSAASFHHIFVSQIAGATGNNALLYVDGSLYASLAVAVYPTWTAGTIKVCVGNNANTLPFKGLIGEAFGFNRGLSAGEIKQLYQATRGNYA